MLTTMVKLNNLFMNSYILDAVKGGVVLGLG